MKTSSSTNMERLVDREGVEYIEIIILMTAFIKLLKEIFNFLGSIANKKIGVR